MWSQLFNKGALSNRDFRWFYTGRTISLFGSGMTPVAMAFAVLQARNGQQLLGYVLTAEILPSVLMVLLGGSLADRYRRDRLLSFSNVGAGLTQAGIAAIVLGNANPYLIFPLAVMNGLLSSLTSPALRGIVPEIVRDSPHHVRQANALLNASRSMAKVVGPAVAGVLAGTIGGGFGIAVDALSFFIAAACLTQLRIPSHPALAKQSLILDMREGWTYFRQRSWIWSITVAFTLMNAIQMGVWRVLGPIIAKHSFGAAGWGVTQSVQSAGLLAASLVMLKLRLRRPLRDCMIAIALSGIPMVALGQAYPLVFLLVAALLAGFGQAISGVAWDSSLQRAVPKRMLSRVCAFDDFGSYVAIPIGVMLAVPVATKLSFHLVATVGGLLYVAIALLPLLRRAIRQMTPEHIESLGLQQEIHE